MQLIFCHALAFQICSLPWTLLTLLLLVHDYVSHSLNSLKGVIRGLYRGVVYGLLKGILGV